MPPHIGHSYVQRQIRTSGAETTKDGTRYRRTSVHNFKPAVHQPTCPWRLVIFQDSGRGHFLQLFSEILSKLHWSQSLTDRHFSIRIGFVPRECSCVDAERPNVNR